MVINYASFKDLGRRRTRMKTTASPPVRPWREWTVKHHSSRYTQSCSQDCHARAACQDVCSSEWPFRARDGRAASSDDDDANTDRCDSHKRGLTSSHTTLHACGMYGCTRTCTSHPTLSSTLMATSTSPPFVRAWSWPSACCWVGERASWFIV